MSSIEWFRLWFSSPYYELLYENRNKQEAEFCVKNFVEILQIPEKSTVLDIACGKGRHSIPLAAYGFDVTGIDIAPALITAAKEYETDSLHFYVHDMRLPFWINYFDYAFNLFTSFGYFRTMREHHDAIRTMAQSLKLNGIIVIDYLNTHYAEEHLVADEEKIINNVRFTIKRWFDDNCFYKQIDINDKEKNIQENFREEVRKFSLGDFTDMLAYEGLMIERVFGNYDLDPYHVNKSQRMIMIAKKIHY